MPGRFQAQEVEVIVARRMEQLLRRYGGAAARYGAVDGRPLEAALRRLLLRQAVGGTGWRPADERAMKDFLEKMELAVRAAVLTPNGPPHSHGPTAMVTACAPLLAA